MIDLKDNNKTEFSMVHGVLNIQGSDHLQKFVHDNLLFLDQQLREFQKVVEQRGDVSFCLEETDWTVAATISKREFGQVSNASGIFYEGRAQSLDVLIQTPSNSIKA